jgi:hypothetical protein
MQIAVKCNPSFNRGFDGFSLSRYAKWVFLMGTPLLPVLSWAPGIKVVYDVSLHGCELSH